MRRKKVVFQQGDLVWVNGNAYKVDLPGDHYNVSATFNVAGLSLFLPELDNPLDSRSSPSDEGENDADGPLDSNTGPNLACR